MKMTRHFPTLKSCYNLRVQRSWNSQRTFSCVEITVIAVHDLIPMLVLSGAFKVGQKAAELRGCFRESW